MRKVLLVCLSIGLIFPAAGPVRGEVNKELTDLLNQALAHETHSKRQCEYHSEEFGVSIPYHQIIMDKERTIEALTGVIVNLGAPVTAGFLPIVRMNNLSRALNRDAYAQIELIKIYDELLSRFGYPEVRRLIIRFRAQADRHFKFLSNACQKIMIMEAKN